VNVNKNGTVEVSSEKSVQFKFITRDYEIAEEKIDVLSGLWKNLFEPEIGVEHMKMLLDHVEAFFTEAFIISET
jgi:flagellar biosynthesis protein FlhB